MNDNLIFRKTIPARNLFEKYPSDWDHEYKKKLFDISCPPDGTHSGDITITRWKSLTIPETVDTGSSSTEIDRNSSN